MNVTKVERNQIDGIRLNPKCSHNRKSAAKPRNRKVQRLFRKEVHPSGWKRGACLVHEDIVWSYVKA